MNNTWEKFLGFGGLISQANLDQGDTCQRVGLFYALAKLLGQERNYRNEELQYGLDLDLKALSAGNGRYRRSPNPDFWGYNPNCLSRDNSQMLMLAMAVMGRKDKLLESFLSIIRHFGFFQNVAPGTDAPPEFRKIPDFMTPSTLTVFIRGMDFWILYPILLILDLLMFLDLIFRKKSLWDYDNMLAVNIFYAVKKFPTPWSLLVFKLYKKSDFISRIKFYYSEDKNGIPPMADLYQACFQKLERENE